MTQSLRTAARRVAALVACGLPLLAACAEPVSSEQPRSIRIVTGVPSGSFAAAGPALADVLRASVPEVAPVVVSNSVTALENFERLNDGTADLAFSFANVAYGESLGHVPGRSAALTPTRAIALLQHATLHFVTAPHSPVRTVGDLRGRRASFGSRSGSAVTVNVVLRAFGLNPTTIQSRSGIDEDITALLGGRLDAMFMLGTQPSSSVQKAIAGGAQLLALRGPEIEQLLRQYPFYSALVIPPGTYEGLSKPVVTIGVNGVLLCRGDLDDDTVYRLTKAMYEAAPGSPADQVLAHWVDVSIGAATPIPLHPGAARYYRERELSP